MEIIVGVVGLVVGAVVGALVMRNNYKHFRLQEAEIKQMILDGKLNASQIVTRIRSRLKV